MLISSCKSTGGDRREALAGDNREDARKQKKRSNVVTKNCIDRLRRGGEKNQTGTSDIATIKQQDWGK